MMHVAPIISYDNGHRGRVKMGKENGRDREMKGVNRQMKNQEMIPTVVPKIY